MTERYPWSSKSSVLTGHRVGVLIKGGIKAVQPIFKGHAPWVYIGSIKALRQRKRPGNKAITLRVIKGGKDGEVAPDPQKLTAKQRAYCKAFVKGMNESDAYRHAYNAEKMSVNSVHREASALMMNRKVAETIRRQLAAREGGEVQSALSRRRFVMERLVIEAKQATNDGARVRALELLGKVAGVDLFRDVSVESDEVRTPDELLEEVEARLRRAFSKE